MAEASGQRVSAEELVSSIDTGGRDPRGWQRNLIPVIAFIWALFQLYIASALPFTFQEWTGLPFVVPNTEARMIHLAFGLLLAALAFPLLKRGPRHYIPWYDWLLAAVGIASCLYMILYRDELAERAGLPTDTDLVIASCGMVVLAISVYRALGLPLVVVASVFVFYVFFGDARWLPDAVQWKGASFGKAMWHFWLQTEGVFGVALGVSASLIFLFVMFGAILEKAGRRQLLHQDRLRPARRPARRPGQGGGRRFRAERPLLRLFHRQHGHHRHLHHPADEAHRLFAGKGRRRRGRLLDQRAVDAAGDGRRGLPDRRIHRRQLHGYHQARADPGPRLLHRAGLYRASGSPEAGAEGACRNRPRR